MNLGTFLLSIIPSGISCFFGFKLQRLFLCLVWFLTGYCITQAIFGAFQIESIFAVIISIIMGFVLAICSLKLQKAAFFILLFLTGYLSIYFFTSHVWYNTILAIVFGGVLGALAVKLYEPMIILFTSLTGAFSIMNVITQFFHLEMIVYEILIFLVFAGLGLWYQVTCYQRENHEHSKTNKLLKKHKKA